MTGNNWLALFILGLISVATYLIATRPEITPEDLDEEDWWG
jgi:hypothetical protein